MNQKQCGGSSLFTFFPQGIFVWMQMDIQARITTIPITTTKALSLSFFLSRIQKSSSSNSLSPSSYHYLPLRPLCSKRSSKNQDPKQNGDSNGDKFSTDWDKAWSNFRKQGKKTFFSQFSPNKYVTWNPRQSNYPLSEEVDPIKRTERSNLMLWTGPRFTLVVAILIVSFLLLYTILYPTK